MMLCIMQLKKIEEIKEVGTVEGPMFKMNQAFPVLFLVLRAE